MGTAAAVKHNSDTENVVQIAPDLDDEMVAALLFLARMTYNPPLGGTLIRAIHTLGEAGLLHFDAYGEQDVSPRGRLVARLLLSQRLARTIRGQSAFNPTAAA